MNYNGNHISYHNGPYDRLSPTSLTLFARLKFIKKKRNSKTVEERKPMNLP